MSEKVEIKAHCGTNGSVCVDVVDRKTGNEYRHVLGDGETITRRISEQREIRIRKSDDDMGA